jgi:hypothetical protein
MKLSIGLTCKYFSYSKAILILFAPSINEGADYKNFSYMNRQTSPVRLQ